MKNEIGIRREDLSKTGEKRVAISPELAKKIVEAGYSLRIQPGIHPVTEVNKRAFSDEVYAEAGAIITEDISNSNVIFGLKEIDKDQIFPNKTYLFFSHTHKGQLKNRKMMAELMQKACTVLDYELVTAEGGARLITAFTFMAGRAGMIDSLWTLGKRLKMEGIENPFIRIPQSIEKENLNVILNLVKESSKEISEKGTPANLPPFIVCFLGDGKTSMGAQEIFDLLPLKKIGVGDLEEVYKNGSRNCVYKLVLDINTMYRLKPGEGNFQAEFQAWPADERRALYLKEPERFESALDKILPYVTMVMNCIIWAPKFPRVITNEIAMAAANAGSPLRVLGDISCDPNGGVEFSKETWIDNPVYIYHPIAQTLTDGFNGEGIAVMAVANLPCEFSTDASSQFSRDIEKMIPQLLAADFNGTFENSGMPGPFKRSCILWQGKFTERYKYMEEYLVAQKI